VTHWTQEQLDAYKARAAAPDEHCVLLAPVAALPTPESAVLKAVLDVLRLHRGVAWCARMNSGRFQIEGRWVQASFKGCADILGQLTDGRLLAIECKSDKGKTTDEQAAFLRHVRDNHGIAFVARSVDDVMVNLSAVLAGEAA
jgi:hypothetical protein